MPENVARTYRVLACETAQPTVCGPPTTRTTQAATIEAIEFGVELATEPDDNTPVCHER
jgi:hypothetical protein